MNLLSNTSKLLNTVFDILDRQFLDTYVIMNKYDEMPESIPSDIDINISQIDFQRLDFIITELSKETGLLITQKIWSNYRQCAYILSSINLTQPFRVQLDFFSDFGMTSIPLLIPCVEINCNTRRYGRFNVPAYHVEYVFLLFRRIFKNDFSVAHCHTLKTALNHDVDKIVAYSALYFGNELANEISDKVLKEDINGLLKIRPILLKQMNKHSLKQAFGSYYFRYWYDHLIRTIFRVKYPVGMSIALLGPDGCGKSTIYEKIEYICYGSFHGIEKKYFRPRLFKNIGHYNILNPTEEGETNPDPHGVSQDSFFKSLVRYSFYNIDFVLGYWLIIKKLEIKKKLVIFDRYYYDYYVDMKRYKYNLPKWLPRLWGWLIPKPDLIFILDGNAQVFYERKKELTLEELERQIIEYRKLAASIRNTLLINAIKPIDKVSMSITNHILLYKAERTAKMMGNTLNDSGLPI